MLASVPASRFRFDSFGNIKTGNSTLTRYLYTGQEYDPDVALYYYNARWFDPKLGKFMSEDPIRWDGGDLNLSRYVGNKVTNFVDPTGFVEKPREFKWTMWDYFWQVWWYGNQPTRPPGNGLDRPKKPDPLIVTPGEGAGPLEGMVPIWGSGKDAYYHFSEKHYVRGVIYTGLAVADIFLISSILKGTGKCGAKEAFTSMGEITVKKYTDSVPSLL